MSVRRAQALTITLAPIDPNNRPARKTGFVFTTGSVQISKDGGAFANTGSLPAEIGSLSGRYSLALTATEMDASWVHIKISKTGIDDIDIMLGTSSGQTGLVVTDVGNLATYFKTNLGTAVDDYWKDCLILFTTGNLAGQVKKVSLYSGSTKFITVSVAFTGVPANGDQFILVNI